MDAQNHSIALPSSFAAASAFRGVVQAKRCIDTPRSLAHPGEISSEVKIGATREARLAGRMPCDIGSDSAWPVSDDYIGEDDRASRTMDWVQTAVATARQ
jgi:hypothetical protein